MAEPTEYTPTTEFREALEDAVRSAMESRQGGLVADIPRGPRNWGEADGYWIAMHVGPVVDAMLAALAAHDAEVRADQREKNATIAESEILHTGYSVNADIAREIREGRS